MAHADRVGVGKRQADRPRTVAWSLTILFNSPPTFCRVRMLGSKRETMEFLRS